MGYTHYWRIPDTARWRQTWPQLVRDTHLIVQAAGVPLTRDMEGDDTPPRINLQGIHLNGYEHSHESFILEPRKTDFDCCKTLRKEYDVVVAAILLRASMLAGDAINVSSDGYWDEDSWVNARQLVGNLWPAEEIVCCLPNGEEG